LRKYWFTESNHGVMTSYRKVIFNWWPWPLFLLSPSVHVRCYVLHFKRKQAGLQDDVVVPLVKRYVEKKLILLKNYKQISC
jgi:hypothetical protein